MLSTEAALCLLRAKANQNPVLCPTWRDPREGLCTRGRSGTHTHTQREGQGPILGAQVCKPWAGASTPRILGQEGKF